MHAARDGASHHRLMASNVLVELLTASSLKQKTRYWLLQQVERIGEGEVLFMLKLELASADVVAK